MRILRARLLAAAQEEAAAAASDARRSQVRTVDRSERIRTYNFPENRISDHRTGYKAYNLDQVLDGDLQPVLDSCVAMDLADRLAALDQPEALGGPQTTAAARLGGRRRRRAPTTTPSRAARPRRSAWTASRLALVDEVPAEAVLAASRRSSYAARAREPLQHLTGEAWFRHVRLEVGPGVFTPRPETELLAGWAVEAGEHAWSVPRGGRPLHRLRRDRQGDRRRGA